jgi:DNA-binding winged helix-turn-helix (wHTH) protein
MDRPLERDVVARFQDFELDSRAGELRFRGEKVPLQEKPLRILQRLVDCPGDVVTRDQLRQALWSADTFVDFDGGVNTAVNKLRTALGDSAAQPRFIETVGRRGYGSWRRWKRVTRVSPGTTCARRRTRRRPRPRWLREKTAAGGSRSPFVPSPPWPPRSSSGRRRAAVPARACPSSGRSP